MASYFWGGGQNAVAKPLESAALDRAGTRARGAAPPAGHGPIRAPKLGAGVLDAVLHAGKPAPCGYAFACPAHAWPPSAQAPHSASNGHAFACPAPAWRPSAQAPHSASTSPCLWRCFPAWRPSAQASLRVFDPRAMSFRYPMLRAGRPPTHSKTLVNPEQNEQ